jgi:hypothetical protein
MNNIAYCIGGILIILKALGYIQDLSWWWCTFPFWIEIVSIIVVVGVINVMEILKEFFNS